MSDSVKSVSVVLLHAYSPKNSGDGLLVELSLGILREAFGNPVVNVVALEADAFEGIDVLQWRGPIGFGDSARGRRLGMLSTVALGANEEIRKSVRDADIVVAVGGGYLRGGSASELLKTAGAHLGQMRLAARDGSKAVYFPQSIGPFHPLAQSIFLRQLRKFATVALRDDRSLADFGAAPGVKRMPDLAVMQLATQEALSRPSYVGGKPIIVARNIPRPRGYYEFLQQASASNEFDWALQSVGGGNDDYGITERLSGKPPRKLAEVMAASSPRVVVSTRLHGSMAALLEGFPTVHLSYERKGWGAFDDLGISEFVLNARDADLSTVNRLIDQIDRDPAGYWERVDASIPRILRSRAQLIDSVRAAHASGPRTSTHEDTRMSR